MARTPLAQAVEDGFLASIDRRTLIKRAGAAAIGASMLGMLAEPRRARGAPAPGTRIVIVGAGLAGLVCGYRLRQAGYAAQIYEASSRIGGRCWTGRGDFADGQIYEHGGELIDSGHTDTKQLAQELGLDLDNLLQAETKLTEQLGWFLGKPYTPAEMSTDLKAIWQQLHSDVTAASYPTLYNVSTQRGRELDAMSLYAWIESYVPGGHNSQLGQLLDVAYNIEYGAESSVQSSLNMLYLLGYVGPGQFRTFGKSNEKFRVRGGNDQMPAALAAQLASQITFDAPLTSIKLNADGSTYTLAVGGKNVVADHVVLALPFSTLRLVDFSKAGFDQRKTWAIKELGMGSNSKVHVQFTSRFWRAQGCNGETYSDRGYQNTWEVSRAQAGTSGLLVWYTGGNPGAAVGSGTVASQVQKTLLPALEPVLPGATKQWNGNATRDYWTGNQWTRGSYAYWKVGQYTRFSGAEKEPSGNCHFAGEHTSQDNQGYLQGAIETGARAAQEILKP